MYTILPQENIFLERKRRAVVPSRPLATTSDAKVADNAEEPEPTAPPS